MDPSYGAAISNIESGGNYSILGPETKGDRAYGKYQIMGNNIGPWSREILGQEVTPEQFLANPQLQDAVFQGKFSQYVEKYGPEGAAKAWFAGEKGMNNPNAKDVLGTSVASYGAKFMKGLGQQPQNPPVAPQMPAGAVQPPDMPAYGWSPNNSQAYGSGVAASQPAMETPQFQPLSAPPINYAQRRPPDPAQLKALLALNPAIAPGFRFLRT